MAKTERSAQLQRRHFAFIAETLRKSKPVNPNDGTDAGAWDNRNQLVGWRNTVNVFTDELAKTNSRFDKTRFLDATGFFFA
jgi:hypothetical protein